MSKKLLILVVAQLVAILTFSAGFFPQKSVLKGDAEFNFQPDEQRQISPKFNKLVLIVIDALRSDFVFQKDMSNFEFVHGLLNRGQAWGYTAYSNPPTVTLPRLKGITTGSTPNFLDAILNVAEDDSSSNLKEQDSWLRQFHINNKRIKFFGDDTWLKLFPQEFFDETDGTNSFFVSDFEEVDFNVTRHLPKQLATQDSWDVLILHFLGLDHIGHKGGAFSHFMAPKQREMDEVIEQVYNSVGEDTLICVMGDHGMNDLGNHGGSSAGETSAGLIFISRLLEGYEKPLAQNHETFPIKTKNDDYSYVSKVNQIDLVPSISSLFNFPIPKNSIGVVMPDVLRLLSPKDAQLKLMDNYLQLTTISGDLMANSSDQDVIYQHMRDIQGDLAKNATKYNYFMLGFGFSLLFITAIATFLLLKPTISKPALVLLIGVSLLLSLSTFGSSFVEEEHQLWWWLAIALTGASYTQAPSEIKEHLIILLCLRLIRGWNNSGQKYTYEHTLLEILKQKYQLQWLLITLTIFVTQFRAKNKGLVSFQCSFLVSTLCLIYKATWSIVNGEKVPSWLQRVVMKSFSIMNGENNSQADLKESLVPMARLFFKTILAVTLLEIVLHKWNPDRKRFLHNIQAYCTAFLILQTSPANIPQFLVYLILSEKLESVWRRREWSPSILMLAGIVLQNLAFFQFGNTNSIATVNLTNAYNGISENYNIYVVGFLMCVSNFAPSIYWSLNCLKILYSFPVKDKWKIFLASRMPSFLFYCIFGCFLLGSCVILRYHLFIWSVFSPKLCYYVSWNIFMNAVIGWLVEATLLVF